MKKRNRIRQLAAIVLTCVLSVTFAAFVCAEEYDDPETELKAEFTNEVFDDDGEYPVEFTIGFGTHTKMPEGTSAELIIRADEGVSVEGMDDRGVRVYSYSSIASDRYVCRTSSNGGFYPSYGEAVRLKPFDAKDTVLFTLYIQDKEGGIIHTEQARVYTVKRDGIIAVSSEGYDDAEQKLDKPFYRLMLFLKTPLGTAAKIAAFIILAGGMYSALHYKDIKRFFKAKKALRRERIIERPYKDDKDNGGDNNG